MEQEVIITGTLFDVHADNYEEFDQEINPEKLGALFKQNNTLKGTTRSFQLYSKSHLIISVTKKNRKKIKSFWVNLACLSPQPEHIKIRPWKWLYLAVATMVIAGVSLYASNIGLLSTEYSYIATIICAASSSIFLLIFLYAMRDEYIFKSCFGGARLFLTENKKPDQQHYEHFHQAMQKIINNAQEQQTITERLVAEMKMCRRLRDEGILNDDTYTAVRSTIFAHDQYKLSTGASTQ